MLPITQHPAIRRHLAGVPYPFLFVTISGAHLYGFASPDSDIDLRGSHITPAREALSLHPPSDTVEVMDKSPGAEIDLVSHDARKFFLLLLKRNGYVLEQIFSPLVVVAAPEFEELRAIAPRCITRHHRHHYRSFAASQWRLVTRKDRPTVKGLLYTYRVLLAGIHLMRTGRVESNLLRLADAERLPLIQDLVDRKLAGAEKQALDPAEIAGHEAQLDRLAAELDAAAEASHLPDEPAPGARLALSDLLVRLRMRTVGL